MSNLGYYSQDSKCVVRNFGPVSFHSCVEFHAVLFFLVDLGTQRWHRTTVLMLMRPNLEWARWLLDCQWGQSHKDPEGIKQVLSTMLHERNVTSEVPCRSNVGQWLTTPLHTSLVRVPCGGSKNCFVLGLVLVASVLTRDCFLCIHVLSIWFHGKQAHEQRHEEHAAILAKRSWTTMNQSSPA